MQKFHDTIKKIESRLSNTLIADRYWVRRQLKRIRKQRRRDEKTEQALARIQKRVESSSLKRSWRSANRPKPTFDDALPITGHQGEIIEGIRNHPVLIISGETGSGKSTQIPKFCLAAGRGIRGMIGCTQPRRIAASTVSKRIADELGEPLGRSVGYKIRFTDKTHPSSFIKVMTDGILLAETQTDPYLTRYDALIVDEAHERSLNIDFLLGILRRLIKRRRDLRLIVTSATIDTEKFSNAFDGAPIIEVSGRMYPVDVRYAAEEAPDADASHIDAAVDAVADLQRESRHGDILVFMPTEQDIRETRDAIEGREFPGVIVLPLFARLTAVEQARVFSRSAGRKIIVATNVAETAITIPGIKYVVDTGLARISQYSPRTRTTSLPVSAISKSSADQRKGRCGRVENGVCIRLYPEDDFDARPVFTPPEILRSNLAEVILRMIALNLGDVSGFPFIDAPPAKSIQDGFDLLSELGAIAPNPRHGKSVSAASHILTPRGEMMAKLPIDPRLSRMLIEAQHQGCAAEMIIIAAALAIQDPRERPAEKTTEADQMHRTFSDTDSDFITLLNIWKRYHHVLETEKTNAGLRRFCKKHFLSYMRMREWRDIHHQIGAIMKDVGLFLDTGKTPGQIESDRGQPDVIRPDVRPDEIRPDDIPPDQIPAEGSRIGGEHAAVYRGVHRSVLSGFLSSIAGKKDKNIYKAAKGREVMVFPGSCLFNRGKQWIVAAEMVETSRLFARCAGSIEEAWILDIGREQCKYTHHHPRWVKSRGEVVAAEQVSLYGLVIVAERTVSYGPIDPEAASDIFVRDALMAGEINEKIGEKIGETFGFLAHNRSLVHEITDLENRFRRRDLLVEEETRFRFYKERLAGVYDTATLRDRIRRAGSDDFLKMTDKFLLRYTPDTDAVALFPDAVSMGGHRVHCHYKYDPGKPDDGVSIRLPVTAASAIPPDAVDWMVPGLFKEKVAAMIKGLSKPYRKRLVPISKVADAVCEEMPRTEASLMTSLSRFIHRRFGVDIPAAAWSEDDLPAYLKMRICLTDTRGKEIRSGRDKTLLTGGTAGPEAADDAEEFRCAKRKWEKSSIKRWDFGDLPETAPMEGKNGVQWVYYPGLEKRDGAVNLRLFRHRDQALAAHRLGVAGLFAIVLSKEFKFLRRTLTLPPGTTGAAAYFGGVRQIETQLYDSVVSDLFCRNIRSPGAFSNHAETVKPTMHQVGKDKQESAVALLHQNRETRTLLSQLEAANRANRSVSTYLKHLQAELFRLVPENFIALYDARRLRHIVRYLKAMAIRAQKGAVDIERDGLRAGELKVYTDALEALLKALSPSASHEKRKEIEAFFWLIEEYKVSLFAQMLKTALPVSKKRLDAKIKEIRRMV